MRRNRVDIYAQEQGRYLCVGIGQIFMIFMRRNRVDIYRKRVEFMRRNRVDIYAQEYGRYLCAYCRIGQIFMRRNRQVDIYAQEQGRYLCVGRNRVDICGRYLFMRRNRNRVDRVDFPRRNMRRYRYLCEQERVGIGQIFMRRNKVDIYRVDIYAQE